MPLVLNGTTGVQDNSGAFVQGTAVASTSGTSIDFTSIPSWVKRVTVMFRGVSLNGTSAINIQLGTGGTPTTTGYSAQAASISSVTSLNTSTSGFIAIMGLAAAEMNGSIVFTNQTGNTWTATGTLGNTISVSFINYLSGSVALSGTLNMVRITTVNGTDTFDAGTINILYE